MTDAIRPPRPGDDIPTVSGGFPVAFAQGRQRRRRRLALVSGGGGAMVVGVVLGGLLISSGGTSTLVQADEPTPSASSEPSPSSSAIVPTGDPAPMPSGEPSADRSTSPGAEPQSPGGTASTNPSTPTEAAARPSAARPRAAASEPISRDYDSTVPRPSQSSVEGGGSFVGCPRGSDWCGDASATFSEGREGPRLSLAHRICREAAGTQDHLTFDTTQEAEFEIWSGARLVWRWSDGADVAPGPHELPVEPGACYTWATGFDARGLPPGDYTLRAWVTADELGRDNAHGAEVRVEE